MDKQEKLNKRRAYFVRYRRFWYFLYYFLGGGISFYIYFTKPFGFDPSGNILLGAAVGLAIPLGTMMICVAIHEKFLGLR